MSTTEMTTTAPAMLLPRLAAAAGLDPVKYYAAIKATCGCEGATDESFAVLMMIADRYQLNPMLKQLYLMKTQKGVQAVIPVDGWVPMLVNFRDYLAHDVTLEWDGQPFKGKCVAATCRIWTRTRQEMGMGPFEHSELMGECYRDTGPWKSHPTRMLGHKAVIQATRRAFGIYVMDEDEARNIGEIRPVQPSGYVLPTTKLIEAEVVESEIVEPTTEPKQSEKNENVQVWTVSLSFANTKDLILKLHGEFDECRGRLTLPEIETIEAMFAAKFDSLPKGT